MFTLDTQRFTALHLLSPEVRLKLASLVGVGSICLGDCTEALGQKFVQFVDLGGRRF